MKFLLWLNQFNGILSLCAVLAAIIVPYIIYKKQRKDNLQSIKDELEAMNDMSLFPMSGSHRERYTRQSYLKRQLKHK